MKISKIEISEEFFPLRRPFITALRRVDGVQALHVSIHTDERVSGLGAASPTAVITGDTAESLRNGIPRLGQMLIGRRVEDLNGLIEELHQQGGDPRDNPGVKAALDMALHDLFAQKAGLSLREMLGGGEGEIVSDLTISLGPADRMAGDAVAAAGEGFKTLKIKLGGDVGEDLERFRRIRGETECTLRIDANQGWDVKGTLNFMEACDREGLRVDLLEQPVAARDLKGMALIRRNISCPLAADESVFSPRDALEAAEAGAADIFNIKLLKSGGIRRAGQIAAVAQAAGLSCMIGCMMESPVGIAAALHFAVSEPVIRYYDLDLPYLLAKVPRGYGLECRDNLLISR